MTINVKTITEKSKQKEDNSLKLKTSLWCIFGRLKFQLTIDSCGCYIRVFGVLAEVKM